MQSMKDISVPFSLYDFLAILFPGFAGGLGIYLFFDPTLTKSSTFIQTLGTVNELILLTLVIIVGYFIGHLFNAVSELIIDRPANALLGWTGSRYLANLGILSDQGLHGFAIINHRLKFPKRLYTSCEDDDWLTQVGALLLNSIQAQFGDVALDYGYTFTIIRAFVAKSNPEAAGEAKVFAATGAMFQSLTMAILVVGAALLKGVFTKELSGTLLVPILIGTFGIALLTFFSYRRYKRMWTETIYAGFMAAAGKDN
jgi:hypothetical protein